MCIFMAIMRAREVEQMVRELEAKETVQEGPTGEIARKELYQRDRFKDRYMSKVEK